MSERTRVALLGSTGSIGRQALDVLEAHPERFEVAALAAGRDASRLAEQLARHSPRLVALADEQAASHLELPAGSRLVGGAAALEEIAADEGIDLVLVATGGIVSLAPVLAALRAGTIVATANKETLVAGGHLVMPLARALAHGKGAAAALAWLRPIDSEHSAIWQCVAGEERSDVARLVLTASGGPFRQWPSERLARATAADALAHPTWSMGAKITVDSATLMNKGLEVIEARWLYDVAYDRIEVVIHPQSIIHSLVEFADGSLKAQLGLPDMRIPIQYALTYPRHLPSPAPRVVLAAVPELSFEAPDEERFPALALAREAGSRGPRASAALIAADEVAVARFLSGGLDFPGITALCAEAVARHAGGPPEPDLPELLELDSEVRAWAATFGRAEASHAS
ncbi:MAG TPA: 1-deoxy-D-xylulose-5-phosphate reductoisomerase [Candidatus Limnocylindria bacterium]|nr:1-deoxy-D-xylulose-5-phosphate reductoisomerase [Candidatus Limnocylindria bacterium]